MDLQVATSSEFDLIHHSSDPETGPHIKKAAAAHQWEHIQMQSSRLFSFVWF